MLEVSRHSRGAIYDKKRSEGPQEGARVSADENEDERRVNGTEMVYVDVGWSQTGTDPRKLPTDGATVLPWW